MTRTHESRETALTLINNAVFYSSVKPVMENLAAKLAAGKFEAEKAATAFVGFISAAVTKPNGEWKTVYGAWRPTMADRKLAAAEMLEHYADQICEMAAELAGPEYLCVRVFDFDHDGCGNPTAKHVIYTSTVDGGIVRRLTDEKCRRQQVGYANTRDDSVIPTMVKFGYKPFNYQRYKVSGDRCEDNIEFVFKRKQFKIEGV